MLIGTPGAIRTRDLSLRRRTLYPAELRVHYLTGVIVALQTEVVKSKTVEAQIYPVEASNIGDTFLSKRAVKGRCGDFRSKAKKILPDLDCGFLLV